MRLFALICKLKCPHLDYLHSMYGAQIHPVGAGRSRERLRGMGGNLIANAWLEEHMVTGYEGGWFTMNPGGEEDASIGDNTTSRWLNFYIKGQQYLFEEVSWSRLRWSHALSYVCD